jgi:hypothetical protein
MRRPLFGNGFPVQMLNSDGDIEVIDGSDYTPQEKAPSALAVTLFCWTWQQFATAADTAKLPAPAVSLVTDGSETPVARRSVDAVTAFQLAGTSDIALPIKLLDRFVIRGDQQIKAANLNNLSTGDGIYCFIYGYFEMVGEIVPTVPFRPLMPEALEEPFAAVPTVVNVANATTESFATAHQLYANYIDLLTLNVDANQAGAEGDNGSAFVRFPNGILLPIPCTDDGTRFQSRPFDYQPMTPASNTAVNVEVGWDTSGDNGDVGLTAYGSFLRR